MYGPNKSVKTAITSIPDGACGKVQREPEISGCLQRLESQIAILEDTAGTLISRIRPIRRDEPATEAVDEKPPVSSCELAAVLSSMEDRIVSLRRGIEYQLSVLEI